MKSLLINIVILVSTSVNCQTKQSLIIGEQLPGFFNYLHSEFKQKPIIIDLFTSYCVTCFEMMPKIDSFSVEFKDKVNFILVGKKDKNEKLVFERIKNIMKINLPLYFDTTIFENLKIPYVPLYLWVDNKGILQAVTGPDEMSKNNLEMFIKERFSYSVVQKRDFDYRKPFLLQGNGGNDSTYLTRSIISSWNNTLPIYLPNRASFHGQWPIFQVLGASIEKLYLYAYLGKPDWKYGDSLYGKYSTSVKGTDTIDEKFCYSLSVIDSVGKNVQEIMKNDLNSFFGYEVKRIKIENWHWRLVTKISEIEKILSKEEKTNIKIWNTGVDIKNATLDQLLKAVSTYVLTDDILINQSGITEKIDIEFNADMRNWKDVKDKLETKGLRFAKEKSEINRLILLQK